MDKNDLDNIVSDFISERNALSAELIKQHPDLRLSMAQMTETYVIKKMAEFEYRLRQLESINKPIK